MAETLISREREFYYDFLGVRTRTRYVQLPQWVEGHIFGITRPDERFLHAREEWLGMLNAVANARGRFVAIELGAGWGPWLVASYAAARRCGIRDIKLVGVEGLSEHVDMMRQHFIDNGIRPEKHVIHHAVVGTEDGTAWFPVVKDAVVDWGARATFSDTPPTNAIPIACISLPTLLAPFDHVDLIHCDIQGEERTVLPAAIDVLTPRVGRLIVGTHGPDIHAELIKFFREAGWVLEFEGAQTPTDDGTLVFANPRARPPRTLIRRLRHRLRL